MLLLMRFWLQWESVSLLDEMIYRTIPLIIFGKLINLLHSRRVINMYIGLVADIAII